MLDTATDELSPWTHIAPLGEFPGTVEIPAGYDVPGYGIVQKDMNVEGITVFNDQTLVSIVQNFNGPILIDADHLSSNAKNESGAMGWGMELRYSPNHDGLEILAEWTPPGREKILGQVYRYISPEFSGQARFEGGTFKFHPLALKSAGLTNRPKLTTLRPVGVAGTGFSPSPLEQKKAAAIRSRAMGIMVREGKPFRQAFDQVASGHP